MKVRIGWSEEIQGAWVKMDVEVEESDFETYLAEKDHYPSSLNLTSVEKFRVMHLLAEVFVYLHKMTMYPEVFSTPEHKKKFADIVATRDALVLRAEERENDKPPF